MHKVIFLKGVGALLLLSASSFATVAVSQPAPGATSGSPVTFVATASTKCTKGVASIGIYVENSLKYVVNGASLSTKLALNPGTYNTVVEEWDKCGGATYTPLRITVKNQVGVHIISPGAGTVGSPVNFQATATSACAKGVASMGIYINNSLKYTVLGASLNTQLSLGAGTYKAVVEEWDHCGGASYTPVNISVQGTTGNKMYNLQASKGWTGYGEYAPAYEICVACGSGVTWSMNQSGSWTEFAIGGTKPYSDVLWTIPLIGQGSTQGLPDTNHTLVPKIHNFIYDAWFFPKNLGATQVLEFDVSQYFSSMTMIWGTQCRIAGGHEWDIWNNATNHWIGTGIPCNPVNGWNHLVIQGQRTSDNRVLYQTITLNGVPHPLNVSYAANKAPAGWYGITLNYQQDGNYRQSTYSVVVDQLHFTYW